MTVLNENNFLLFVDPEDQKQKLLLCSKIGQDSQGRNLYRIEQHTQLFTNHGLEELLASLKNKNSEFKTKISLYSIPLAAADAPQVYHFKLNYSNQEKSFKLEQIALRSFIQQHLGTDAPTTRHLSSKHMQKLLNNMVHKIFNELAESPQATLAIHSASQDISISQSIQVIVSSKLRASESPVEEEDSKELIEAAAPIKLEMSSPFELEDVAHFHPFSQKILEMLKDEPHIDPKNIEIFHEKVKQVLNESTNEQLKNDIIYLGRLVAHAQFPQFLKEEIKKNLIFALQPEHAEQIRKMDLETFSLILEEKLEKLFNQIFVDQYKMLIALTPKDSPLENWLREYHYNMALCAKLDDENYKQLKFDLCTNWGARTASFQAHDLPHTVLDQVRNDYQLDMSDITYSRHAVTYKKLFLNKIMPYLGASKQQINKNSIEIIPLTAFDVEDIFALKYRPLNAPYLFTKIDDNKKIELLTCDLLKLDRDQSDNRKLIIECTRHLQSLDDKKAFAQFNSLGALYIKAKKQARENIMKANLTKKEIELLIDTISSSIFCWRREINQTPFILICHAQSKFSTFLNEAGLRPGAVQRREFLSRWCSLYEVLQSEAQAMLVAYAPDLMPHSPTDAAKAPNLFHKKSDIIKLCSIDHFFNTNILHADPHPSADSSELLHPGEMTAIHNLGEDVLHKIKTLFGAEGWVTDVKWLEIRGNPLLNELVQTIIYRMKEHLAHAQLHKNNFKEFEQAIELVDYEINSLLRIFLPFTIEDIEKLHKQAIQSIIPTGVEECVHAGLGKSATFNMAKINAVAQQKGLEKTHSNEFYYESVNFMSVSQDLDNMLKENKKLGLYFAQFYPNVNIDPNKNLYSTEKIDEDIESILQTEPNELTVAIDCTIDYVQSEKIKALLTKFDKEIKAGQLNFIFYRSGQKFDMCGRDPGAYFSPIWMVNNGDPKWKGYNDILKTPVNQTDKLSQQWFCLNMASDPKAADNYRNMLFSNTREILNQIPAFYKYRADDLQMLKIAEVAPDCLPFFLAINFSAAAVQFGLKNWFKEQLILRLWENGIRVDSKASFGYIDPNIDEIISYLLRITPGLNPRANPIYIQFLNDIIPIVKSVPALPVEYDIKWVENNWNSLRSTKNTPPLHRSIIEGNLTKATVQNCDVNGKDSFGNSALHLAVLKSNREAAKLLIEKGADINAQEELFGNTALHLAILKGDKELVDFLLKNGASASLADKQGHHFMPTVS